jgi:hypothetical protein
MLDDTLRVRAWHDGPGRVIFEAGVDGKVVVSSAHVEYEPEEGAEAAAAAAAAAAAKAQL